MKTMGKMVVAFVLGGLVGSAMAFRFAGSRMITERAEASKLYGEALAAHAKDLTDCLGVIEAQRGRR